MTKQNDNDCSVIEKSSDIIDVVARHSYRPPVNIEGIIRDLSIDLHFLPLGKDVSGYIKAKQANNSKYVIAVNQDHAYVRQRFTMAHELSHYILHKDKIDGEGIVDNAVYRSNIRDEYEREADRSAAKILMPAQMMSDLKGLGYSPKMMAERLQVSEEAVKIRLNNLLKRA